MLFRLEQAGLSPESEADRYTLIRRVWLDLIGIPPTPAEVEAFVNDRSPDAYEKVVDRLLASKRFGEHWARMWMDLARYADTKGYEKDQPRQIWRYRDWVIDAFNADMPYDRFTIEQLAGDLLPNRTDSELLATAFHRNTMTNDEGGTDDEEFRVAAVKDRIDTTVQVWMGLTMGCAKCHSHKYDPITHEEYYRFYAFFNQTEDADRYDDGPTVPMPTPELKQRVTSLEKRRDQLRKEFNKPSPELTQEQRDWERAIAASRPWMTLPVIAASAESGATLSVRTDGAVLATGAKKETDTYTLTAVLPLERVTAVRLEVLNDPSLPKGGPGRHTDDQNAVVSEFLIEKIDPQSAERKPLSLQNSRADFSQKDWEVGKAIDGNPSTGWAWAPANRKPHLAVFDFRETVTALGGKIQITIKQNFPKLQLGCFRLSVSGADPKFLQPEFRSLGEIAAIDAGTRTPDDQKRLDEAFRRQHEPTASIYRQLTAVEKELAVARKEVPNTPILRDLPKDKQRVTRIHQRGNFLDPGAEVKPGLPAAFGSLPEGAPMTRLGVAQWLVSPDNPLTPRVAANRIWARLFGAGLVETEEDFGSQGIVASHPELLDWLAVEYRDALGWSMKKLLRTIVMSATYRQASRKDPATLKADPRNLLISRGPRFRLPAEVIRDQSLAAAGLLSEKMYGPSIMPPQPPGLWKAAYSSMKWETSPGEDRHRRALYTFGRRTSPYPSLTTFDAGSGEVCTIRRVRTNIPLQALITLNDPAFVEAAAALGRRMLTEAGPTNEERADYGFRLVLIRPPSEGEVQRLAAMYEVTRRHFENEAGEAKSLLESANVQVSMNQNPIELAAWTIVGNVLLNLDETVTKP